jgi:cytochrome bd-type quinol oxidase subunit 2
MRRRTFDWLLSTGGIVVTVFLIVAGTLLFVGYAYANNSLTSQLTAQKIFFPPKGSEAIADPAIKPYLEKYAGQQFTNGAQAQA